jgi:4-amino-4-deoxy-L-arabinose transferase-like glycosyltransferase
MLEYRPVPDVETPPTGMPMRRLRSYQAAAAVLVLALTVLRFVYAFGLDLLPDEAYSVVLGQHPDLGYYDHPPLLMWLLGASTWLFGATSAAVRLVPAALSACSWLYVFRLGAALFGRRLAFWGLVLLNVTLLAAAEAIVATVDTPMVLFLSGACYHFHRALTRGRTGSWLLSGLFVGLALLSKYPAVLICGSFLLCLLLAEHRRWLARPQPYVALALALLVFSPVIAWNARHDWISFAFQWNHGLGAGQFPRWEGVVEYLASQAAVVGPIMLGLFLATIISVARSWTREPPERRFLWCLAIVPFAFFMCSSLLQKVEANWPCFAYVPGLLLAVVVYEDRLKPRRWARTLWKANWIYSVVILAAVLLHIYVPLATFADDRAGDFFGWRELGRRVARLASARPDLGIAADRYQIASELVFYTGRPVTCFNIRSRPNQYDLWQDRAALSGRSYLLVDTGPIHTTRTARHFQTLRLLDRVPFTRGSHIVREIFLYEAVGYLADDGR